MNSSELLQLYQKVRELKLEHRDLDQAIRALSEAPYVDQLQMGRLKKRKLLIKDMLTRYESELIPDLDA
ncbi:MAG: DUF465 domain-containing protein [Gammaproteobacteria bacterium]|nr:DUF465 domain-containing protein [Gammaproteobacteria bacterium]